MIDCSWISRKGNGFLRYWTVSNLPLFLLAAPMLTILIKSGIDTIREASAKPSPKEPKDHGPRLRTMKISMAGAQVALAVLALTSYHVQIITRISSGYPVWYWWVAHRLHDREKPWSGRCIVVFMVMYAIIQGVLFASFLPPA